MLRISGRGGELRVAYQVAATLGRWHISEAGDMEIVSVTSHNPFWLGRDDVTFSLRLPVGARMWMWDAVDVVGRAPLMVRLHGDPRIQ